MVVAKIAKSAMVVATFGGSTMVAGSTTVVAGFTESAMVAAIFAGSAMVTA